MRPVRPGALSELLNELLHEPDEIQGSAWDAALEPGAVVGRFELVREIGRGGFGVVYEARDRELGRAVAFKAIRAAGRPEVREDRLLREAEAAARLSHPNIVTLHDVGRSPCGPYLILELLKGQTLAQRLEQGPLPLLEALRIGVEVAKGLAHAHAQGVVHRDLTPGNVFLCDDGNVKVLDLGMSHAFGRRKLEGGTPAYMAPEQCAGAPEDERTDVFALGVILHRMLGNRLPFPQDSRRSVRWSRPAALDIREEPGLGELVSRMLEKDPVRRPRDAAEVLAALGSFERELRRSGSVESQIRVAGPARSRRRIALVAAAAIAACALAAWLGRREARIRWALEEALPQVAELVEQGKYSAAFALAEKVEKVVPGDPRLLKLWPAMSRLVTIETVPEGADVYAREYSAPSGEWRHLGRSPVVAVRLPWVLHRLRIEKKGFAAVEVVPRQPFVEFTRAPVNTDRIPTLRFALDPTDRIPAGMVHVPGGSLALELPGLDHLPPLQIGDFLIDRTEVTNREYKRFVDAGGYRRRELWPQAFVKDGRALSWEEAIALFRDRTGRPGPATWESGDFPEGQGDLPVTGVSWFEAAAFAAFVGKALPNLYQWSRAAGTWAVEQIAPLSNFGETTLARVASHEGVGPYGTYDMAGNAKEWCQNATGSKRYILGGAWDEPSYMFTFADAQSPFARAANFGFRLVKALDDGTALETAEPVSRVMRDFARERPVDAALFQAFKRLYAYDRSPLDARVEATDDSSERWRKEKVSFAAAYGDERVVAYLFTPRHGAPPYQTVVFFPGTSVLFQRSSEELRAMRIVSPVVSSGRALLYPVYKSTYERGDGLSSTYPSPTVSYRDHVIQWAKDVGRSIDFIETRQDLDSRRIAFYGVSWGAKLAPLFAAVDDRIKVGILLGGGLALQPHLPEADPFNFAPYVRQPMLMVNGRYDFLQPVETSQVPLFRLLGPPEKDKRHVIVEAGHLPPNDVVTREVLDWLDRYLGPVR
jgi:formylglycine-generating enzyme required for sulfatase activity/dienelactone hydrolase